MSKISIIVPVYNVEKYLNECIDSLLEQSYRNFEIILVNDGSNDMSSYICDEYSKKYSNIKAIHKKNEGLGFARNTGLDNATGDYVVFIDSDDFADKDLVKDLYEAIKSNNSDTCIGGYRRIDLDNNIVSTHAYDKDKFIKEDIKNILVPRMIGSSPDKKDSISVSSCNVLYSKNIIDKQNIRFVSEREIISEDLIFNLSYLFHAENVVLINKINYNYRINYGSLTTKYLPERFSKIKELYEKEVEILHCKGIYDKCQLRLMRQFFIYVRMCFAQENQNVNAKNINQLRLRVNEICNDDLVKKLVRTYPIYKLGFKQKIFLYLVKYKMNLTISIFIKTKMIK